MTLPVALERLAGRLHEAAETRARQRARRRRARLLAVALVSLAALGSAAVAGGWLGGSPAPSAVKTALRAQLRTTTPQVRALFGVPIADEAIIGASLDSRHFVWGAPTTTGGYCSGLTMPLRVVDGMGCSGASAGWFGSYYDCDGSVIFGGRVGRATMATASRIELRHDGKVLSVPLDPAKHGFVIARLPARFFRDVAPHARTTWPRIAILDAHGALASPARESSGRFPPPDHVLCPN